jgi:hypothetical protein
MQPTDPMSRPRVERGSSTLPTLRVEDLERADVQPALRDFVVLSLRGWLDAIIWSLLRQTQKKTKKEILKALNVPPPSRTGSPLRI